MDCQSKAVKNGIFPPSRYLGSTGRTDTCNCSRNGSAGVGKEARIYLVRGQNGLLIAGSFSSSLHGAHHWNSCESLALPCVAPVWLLRTGPWFLVMVTDCKILVIAGVQEHFNSCLFLVHTGSTGTDLHPCYSQPWCLLFCVVLGHLQPVTRLWGSAVWNIVCALKIIL